MIKNRGTRKTTASNVLLLGSHFLLEKNSLTVPVEPGTTHVDLQSCLRLLSPVRKTPIGERKHYTERSSFHGRTRAHRATGRQDCAGGSGAAEYRHVASQPAWRASAPWGSGL